jgi:hypothetical protein
LANKIGHVVKFHGNNQDGFETQHQTGGQTRGGFGQAGGTQDFQSLQGRRSKSSDVSSKGPTEFFCAQKMFFGYFFCGISLFASNFKQSKQIENNI